MKWYNFLLIEENERIYTSKHRRYLKKNSKSLQMLRVIQKNRYNFVIL